MNSRGRSAWLPSFALASFLLGGDPTFAGTAQRTPVNPFLSAPGDASQAYTSSARLLPCGTITTFAGNGLAGFSGDGGRATNASLYAPAGVALDSKGNLYIADLNNNRIRKIDAKTHVITTVAGNGQFGVSGDGGPAINASLGQPVDVALDPGGNLYIADSYASRIRKVDAQTGDITTVAGNGKFGYSGDGGPAINASLNSPSSIAVDRSGNLYIGDSGNFCIRKVDVQTEDITTVAKKPIISIEGDPFRDLYFVESAKTQISLDNQIRRVDGQTGAIATVASFSDPGYYPGGLYNPGNSPGPLAVDFWGNLYVADSKDGHIRRVDAQTGVVTMIAGTGQAGFSGDGGPVTSASLSFSLYGLALDSEGNLYIADAGNNRIRKVNCVVTEPDSVRGTAPVLPSPSEDFILKPW